MNTQKILTEEIRDLTVASLPTRPTASEELGGRGYSAGEMKAAFDKLPLFIIERLNSLIDDIQASGEGSVSDAIKTDIYEGHTLKALFKDITSGALSGYLTVLDSPLSTHIAQIIKRLSEIEGRLNI